MSEQNAAAHAEHYDPEASRIGMWLFLFTEILLFGTLFIGYAVYLYQHKNEFTAGSGELDLALGATNTIILLTSSLTVALATGALEREKKHAAVGLLGVTVILAAAFLVIKYFEWSAKFAHDIYPGSALFKDLDPGRGIFYGLYFMMTGLHALHILIGLVIIPVAAGLVLAGRVHKDRPSFLENTGLYWHLVDIIWIFLFPLFYLIG